MSKPVGTARKGRHRWVVGVPVLAMAVAAGLLWPGLWRGTPTEQSPEATVANAPATGLAWFPEDQRVRAPDLAGPTLHGERLSLNDLRGHVVVVNVWGSWCAPCRDEAPDLARVARETRSDGVRFLGIDTRDNKAAARAFVRTYDLPYPSLFDPDGSIMLELNGIIPISAVPSTVVVDQHGRVAARVVGKVTYDTLRGLVADAGADRTVGDRRGAGTEGA